MKGEASVKVPEGKLVKLEVDYGDKVEDISITGDFFLEPPEALEEFERALEGLKTDFSRDEVVEELEAVDARTIGFSRKDIAEALKEAVR